MDWRETLKRCRNIVCCLNKNHEENGNIFFILETCFEILIKITVENKKTLGLFHLNIKSKQWERVKLSRMY